jgi:glutathione S-transferase/RNA polymerase-associated protein
MLVLYEFALSPFVQKVKTTLREKVVPFACRDVFDDAHRDELARVSPRGEVPVLVDGEAAIFDSTIILDYIEEKWPEPPLMPADPAARAELRMLEEMCDTQVEAINYGMADVMTFPTGDGAAAETVAQNGRAQMAGIVALLARRLGDAEWFGGERFGRADICVLPHLNAARLMKTITLPERLGAWCRRCNARPSVKQTVAEIKPALAHYKAMIGRIREGTEARQFRDHRLDWLMRSGGTPIVLKRLEAGSIRFSTSYG